MSEKKKENKVQRTKGELFQEAYRQLKFLKQECACYDAGDWDYGRQIAVKLRVLLHDTGMSHSVLRQLTEQFVFNRPDFLDLSTVKGDLPKQGQTRFVRCSLCQYILKRKLQNQPYRRLRKRKQAQQLPKVIRQKSLNSSKTLRPLLS